MFKKTYTAEWDEKRWQWAVIRWVPLTQGGHVGSTIEHHDQQESAEESAWVLNQELEQEIYSEFG